MEETGCKADAPAWLSRGPQPDYLMGSRCSASEQDGRKVADDKHDALKATGSVDLMPTAKSGPRLTEDLLKDCAASQPLLPCS